MDEIDYIIGIDEAGRGPIAGPVTVGMVLIENRKTDIFRGISDSKKLSESQRKMWYEKLKDEMDDGTLHFDSAMVGNSVIDREGIVRSVERGIKRLFRRIRKKFRVGSKNSLILLDGLLKAPQNYSNQRTIVGGDDKVSLISAASIIAKVERDMKMKRFARKHPQYLFELHKGYPTRLHYRKIEEFGPCEIHRKSFLKGLDTVP